MARAHRRARGSTLAFEAITLEGALIAPAMLAKIAALRAGEQKEANYAIPKGLAIRDEIARYFRIGQALFRDFAATPTPSHRATIEFVRSICRDVFGFVDTAAAPTRTIGERSYPVTLEALDGRVPIVVGLSLERLDQPSSVLSDDGHRRSVVSTLQDWLNATESTLWGLASNGDRVRLLRDNESLTRPAYIEADLRHIFADESFADFTELWLLVHASRFGRPGAAVTDCALERWRDAGGREGEAARERLRGGVEAALLALGNGFLSHPDNGLLRAAINGGALSRTNYFGELLRLIYRLIFLFAAEDRDVLHPPNASPAARQLYAEGYALGRLRERAVKRRYRDRHHDQWEGLLIIFAALARGEPALGLPALDGLFARETLPHLDKAKLSNRDVMEAIFRLAWLSEGAAPVPVDWRAMQTEELGSVYESLLELTPLIGDEARSFSFAEGDEAKGHARKTTGSYYTPDSLVQVLLDSALDPVLDRVVAEADDPAQALLAVTVIDPACGSGHFLLSAARRIATRLAKYRSGGVPSTDDYRHALRDVVRACIHGVDKNPMAVELAKVALWIETVDPGKPLGFLDASIRCGDALFGVFDLEALRTGIPDAAYKPLAGDDPDAAKYFAKRNRDEKKGQGYFDFGDKSSTLPPAAPLAETARALRALPEDSTADVATKRKRFEAARHDPRSWNLRIAADLYTAAFLAPKNGGAPVNANSVTIPTTAHVWAAMNGKPVFGPLVGFAQDLSGKAAVFHWPLEFSDVVAAGGFDAVLGNPPWERIKLQEREFFAARDPEIAEAPNAAARSKLIAKLKAAAEGSREKALFVEFETAKRVTEASSIFVREGERFPLTGTGDVNTYGLFAELFVGLLSERGRAGVILPTEILSGDALKEFFQNVISRGVLKTSIGLENEEFIFPGIANVNRFALITLGPADPTKDNFRFAFYLRHLSDFSKSERFFTLSKTDFELFNPNTRTCPVFRSIADANLSKKIYERIPVLIDETNGRTGNPWSLSFMRMFDMANDSRLFLTFDQMQAIGCQRDVDGWGYSEATERRLPLYEGKFVWHYDHRFSSYHNLGKVKGRGGRGLPATTLEEYANPNFEPMPRYWVNDMEISDRLKRADWKRDWLLGWRDTTSAKLERTLVPAAIPRYAVGHKLPLFFPRVEISWVPALLANLSSLTLDYFARQKVAGASLTYHYLRQFPILAPASYAEVDRPFIHSRVLELTYTSYAIAPFARDLGFGGPPFNWDENRRALLRAELDAWYARAYGLTKDELRYILDPTDVMGADYPSESFRVLKKNEIARYGEYRTAKLVLQAWDRLHDGELNA